MENSAAIWNSFVQGEDLSFRSLIFIHYETLYNYGNKFTADSELVKDAIQDLFLNLWNRRQSISQPENIKAYLFSSLRRIILRKIKTHQRTQAEENELDRFDFQVSIELQYIKEEAGLNLVKRMAHAIERLPARQKEVIFLKFYQGFSRNEIAQAMDISPQTVSNLMQIALNKMKGDLGQALDLSILYLVVPLVFKEFF